MVFDTQDTFLREINDSYNDACTISKPVHHKPDAVSWHCIEHNCTQVLMNSNDVIKGSVLNVPDEPMGVLCKRTCLDVKLNQWFVTQFSTMCVFVWYQFGYFWVVLIAKVAIRRQFCLQCTKNINLCQFRSTQITFAINPDFNKPWKCTRKLFKLRSPTPNALSGGLGAFLVWCLALRSYIRDVITCVYHVC